MILAVWGNTQFEWRVNSGLRGQLDYSIVELKPKVVVMSYQSFQFDLGDTDKFSLINVQ